MNILECKALTKRYGSRSALEGVELSIEPGRIVGLLGPNGSGKTTLIKLANGLLTPTSGEIRIDGMKDGAVCEQVMPENGSAYESWLRQGAPEFASVAELSQLESASHPRRFRYSADAGISLAPGEIALVTFELPEMIEP